MAGFDVLLSDRVLDAKRGTTGVQTMKNEVKNEYLRGLWAFIRAGSHKTLQKGLSG